MNITISEVGPRDGLQSIAKIMPLQGKIKWVNALISAGFKDIEIGSIVPPKLLPQMADTVALLDNLKKGGNDLNNSVQFAVLIPNFKGLTMVLPSRPDRVSIPFSCSESHNIKNVNKNHEEMLQEIKKIVEYLSAVSTPKPKFEVGLSTAFGCTIAGKVSFSSILSLAERIRSFGVEEFGVADTTGYANPKMVKELMTSLRYHLGNKSIQSIHLHNTRGLGLANALAAYEVGITTFDGSIAGLGGCPFAPGASGNIVTEDLVYMFESMGVDTGIDIGKLFTIHTILKEYLGDEPLYGFTPAAGLPLNFPSIS